MLRHELTNEVTRWKINVNHCCKWNLNLSHSFTVGAMEKCVNIIYHYYTFARISTINLARWVPLPDALKRTAADTTTNTIPRWSAASKNLEIKLWSAAETVSLRKLSEKCRAIGRQFTDHSRLPAAISARPLAGHGRFGSTLPHCALPRTVSVI